MRITTRARVSFFLSLAALFVVAIAGSRLATADPREGAPTGTEPASGGGGDGMAMCVEGVTDCDDMVVVPADPICGVQVPGTGPDTAVSSDACHDDPAGRVVGDGAQLVEPMPGAADVRPHPFDHAVASDDGRSVTVFFWSGVEPCYVLDRVEVAYGADRVTITLFEGHDPAEEGAICIDIALLKKVVVPLDELIG
ncbi:MAG TPA: hypothetical protein VFQ40_08290, partial [Actinomycetota bacterium]|nr:hypothetical protein [Actinomycetota bacterium]